MSRVGSKGPEGWDTVEAVLCAEPQRSQDEQSGSGDAQPHLGARGGAA